MSGLDEASTASNGDWNVDAAHSVKWMFNCDWPGNVFHSPRMSSEECGPACARKRECTHFTHRDGVCFMKSYPNQFTGGPSLNMPNRVCGTVLWNFDTANKVKWMLNCDFHGSVFNELRMSSEECGPACASVPACTHFTHRDGVCFMKYYPTQLDNGPTLNQQGRVCGQAYTNTGNASPTPGPTLPVIQSFTGHC
jgi:hypothetical protein